MQSLVQTQLHAVGSTVHLSAPSFLVNQFENECDRQTENLFAEPRVLAEFSIAQQLLNCYTDAEYFKRYYSALLSKAQ
jgi:uncharacterized protein (DUF1330 family)